MQNRKYTVQELIQNQSFRRMVNGTASEDEINRWDNWIEDSEENRAKARKAIAEIAGFEFQDPIQPDMEEEWRRLYDRTMGKADAIVTHIPNRNSDWSWIYRIAAILIIGALVGVGFYVYSENNAPSTQVQQITEEHTISTESGEHKTITFSNGSAITLNSNSSVTYTLGVLHNQTIEVVLEGEAYFDAEGRNEESEPIFAVRTPDGVIRDIGTEFLVTTRNDHSRVVLQEGEVEVDTDNSEKAKAKKGEMLAFTKSEVIDKQIVNPTFHTSWATGALEFDKTTVQEFAEFIEQRFGVEVELTDSGLSDITLDGAVYFKSLEGLVRSVSEVTKIPVYQSGDREMVYIGNVNESIPANNK